LNTYKFIAVSVLFSVLAYLTASGEDTKPNKITEQYVDVIKTSLMPSPNVNKKANRDTHHQPNQPTSNTEKFNPTSKSAANNKKIKILSTESTTNNPTGKNKLAYRNDTGKEKMEKYTFWLSLCTGFLFLATVALCVITYLMKKIASQEFSATHRPKVIVHAFENQDTDTIQITFTCVNTGTTNAIFNSISYDIFFSSGFLHPGREMETIEFKNTKKLAPGEKANYTLKSSIKSNSATIEEMKSHRNQPFCDLMCIGKIEYTDNTGAKRETRFCRKRDRTSSNQWLRVENSDYEYSY